MLGAPRHDEGVALAKHDGRFLAIGVAHGDVKLTVEDEEELVGVLVDVPDMVTVGVRDTDVIVVHVSHDSRAVVLVEGLQRGGQVDRLCDHESIVCPHLVVCLNGG